MSRLKEGSVTAKVHDIGSAQVRYWELRRSGWSHFLAEADGLEFDRIVTDHDVRLAGRSTREEVFLDQVGPVVDRSVGIVALAHGR